MAQQNNIVVFDGASTPVSHTLLGVDIERTPSGKTAYWREQLTALPEIAQVSAFQSMTTLKKGGIVRTVSGIEVPVMEAVNGANALGYTAAPRVAYSDRFMLVSLSNPRSSETSRRLAMQMLLNWCSYLTTTQAIVATGPVADLHQRRVMPT